MIEWLSVIILSMSPISELRGAIPTGIAIGLEPYSVFLIAVLFNIILFFPLFFSLKFFYHELKRFKIVRYTIETVRKKEKGFIQKYGIPSLIIFVAIPFPITGAWTGTILAWLFDLDWKKSFIAISLGVLISGIIVFSITLGGMTLLGV